MLAPVRGRWRASRSLPPWVAAAALAVAATALLPAGYLVVRAADAGWGGVWRTLTEPRTIGLFVRTAALTAAVTAASVAVGVPLAWLTVRTDLPARKTFAVVTALPLVIPSYVGGFAIVAALGPNGLLQRVLAPLGVERLPSIYGFTGAWLALTLFTYPYVLLTVRAALRSLDPAFEEASWSLGRDRRTTFLRVVLPQLRPAVVAGGLLVALYTMHDFGAVSLLRFDSFTHAIYVSYHGSFDRSRAAVLSLALVALTLAVVTAESRSRRRAAYHRHRPARPAPDVSLGRWRWPAAAVCCALAVVALGVPVGVVAYWLARSARAGDPLSALLVPGLHSLALGVAAAAVVSVLAWPVALLSARYPGRLARASERASFVGYALPGLVVALSLVFFGARLAPAVYQTLWILLFAYAVLFLPQAVGTQRASLLQISPHLEDAARSLGARRTRVLRTLLLPLARPGIAAGAVLVFLTTIKELPATLLLAPTGYSTLATEVWSATAAAFYDRAAPPALALVALASAPLALVTLRERAR